MFGRPMPTRHALTETLASLPVTTVTIKLSTPLFGPPLLASPIAETKTPDMARIEIEGNN